MNYHLNSDVRDKFLYAPCGKFSAASFSVSNFPRQIFLSLEKFLINAPDEKYLVMKVNGNIVKVAYCDYA